VTPTKYDIAMFAAPDTKIPTAVSPRPMNPIIRALLAAAADEASAGRPAAGAVAA
jgi:hypothetical protein